MRRAGMALGLAVGLTGCASIDYATDEYGSVPLVTHDYQDHTYRIFDKSGANKLMITPTLGAAAGDGAIRGLTLGLFNNDVPEPVFHGAADSYLASTGRKCSVVGQGVLIVRPQWEFHYQCVG